MPTILSPTLILVTHRHGDHYDAETLAALASGGTEVVTCADVHGHDARTG